MKPKKRNFRCLLCGWEGTDPRDIETVDDGWLKVCPVCSQNPDIPTDTLIHYLQIELFDDTGS